VLTFPIKHEWLDLIERGIKKEEYRADTPYYESRLGPYLGQEIECALRNGYSATSPTLKVKVRVEKGAGNPDWGAEPGVTYFKLVILEMRRIEPETFIIKARRCKRCGGLLTSKQAVEDGYGHVCKMKERAEQAAATPDPNQLTLFDVFESEE